MACEAEDEAKKLCRGVALLKAAMVSSSTADVRFLPKFLPIADRSMVVSFPTQYWWSRLSLRRCARYIEIDLRKTWMRFNVTKEEQTNEVYRELHLSSCLLSLTKNTCPEALSDSVTSRPRRKAWSLDKMPLSEPYQRGIRLAVAVLLACLIGYGLIL